MKKYSLILVLFVASFLLYEFPVKKAIATNKFYHLLKVEDSIEKNSIYDLKIIKSFTPEYGYHFVFKVKNSKYDYSFTYKYAQKSWEQYYYDGKGGYLPLPNKKIIF
ncbi:hypothetical protein [Enterococcus termitis]|uniref:DUF3139 domain-containing protein n=1 Tax=Enterococcus termitis TaxID=332950 RepID=A0A1E5G8U4_9ENTE|nr:hypothetical protein [Enterococcus termitis]OEG09134.1 hypothetical protein BCR25_11225 [Enterococcus termitis]